MAYDQDIQEKIESIHSPGKELIAKRMFGGVCYLFQGNMVFGVYKDNLIVRLGSEGDATQAIQTGRAVPFDITGRPMKGWVMIPKSKLKTREQYKRWIERGMAFARSLPPK